jgi:CheY-like chemotaxis protein
MRVLVCDDNVDAAATLAVLLSHNRHDVRVCNDGATCVEKTREWRPQVALIDIGMPGLNGYEVARAIRRMDIGQDVLLIAVTGWGKEEDVRAARAAGFDMHFTKPADAAKLLGAVGSARPTPKEAGN